LDGFCRSKADDGQRRRQEPARRDVHTQQALSDVLKQIDQLISRSPPMQADTSAWTGFAHNMSSLSWWSGNAFRFLAIFLVLAVCWLVYVSGPWISWALSRLSQLGLLDGLRQFVLSQEVQMYIFSAVTIGVFIALLYFGVPGRWVACYVLIVLVLGTGHISALSWRERKLTRVITHLTDLGCIKLIQNRSSTEYGYCKQDIGPDCKVQTDAERKVIRNVIIALDETYETLRFVEAKVAVTKLTTDLALVQTMSHDQEQAKAAEMADEMASLISAIVPMQGDAIALAQQQVDTNPFLTPSRYVNPATCEVVNRHKGMMLYVYSSAARNIPRDLINPRVNEWYGNVTMASLACRDARCEIDMNFMDPKKKAKCRDSKIQVDSSIQIAKQIEESVFPFMDLPDDLRRDCNREVELRPDVDNKKVLTKNVLDALRVHVESSTNTPVFTDSAIWVVNMGLELILGSTIIIGFAALIVMLWGAISGAEPK